MERVLTYEDGRAEVERHALLLPKHKLKIERLPLLESAGRVLAEAIVCDRDLPPFNRSARDGYAVRAADGHARKCIGSVRAGEWPVEKLGPGECMEIMTGAPVPDGADAVIMVEYTRAEQDRVLFERGSSSGENIITSGSEARGGETLLTPGVRLNYSHVAAAASVGAAFLDVCVRPRIAILSTGDEIVPIERQPGPAQIRNSNACSLAAQVARAGGAPVVLPIAPDQTGPLRELIVEGLQQDLLLITGGVSMGKHDLVESVLTELGAEFHFTGAKIQPGKPVVFGAARGSYFFGLPGNPVSTMVTFELFARPMIEALAGEQPQPQRLSVARLTAPVRTKPDLTRFLPAQLAPSLDICAVPEVSPAAWQGSGDIVSIARSNCWLIMPPDRPELAAGELVTILLR